MFKSYVFKTANMRKEQDFTIYPYDGGDKIILQSDSRIISANLRTGEGVINQKVMGHPGFYLLQICPMKMKLPDEIVKKIQSDLWHNNGKEGNISNVVHFEVKELFSVK